MTRRAPAVIDRRGKLLAAAFAQRGPKLSAEHVHWCVCPRGPDGGLDRDASILLMPWFDKLAERLALEEERRVGGPPAYPEMPRYRPLIGWAELWYEIACRPPPEDFTNVLDTRPVKREQYAIFQRVLSQTGNKSQASREAFEPFANLPEGAAMTAESMRTFESKGWPDYLTSL
jgi:hypothetical protein